MPRRKYRGLCPVCQKEALLTRDHVPPDGLFLPPKPSNLITVRTCRECNDGSKLDDEYFRICLALGPNPSREQWRLWSEKIMGSTLTRSPKLRSQLVQDMDAIQEHHKTSPLLFANGMPLTAEQAAQTLPLEKNRIDGSIDKMVRCLHYHINGASLSPAIRTSVSQETPAEYLPQLNNPSGIIGNCREFIFWTDGGYWLLWFYEAILFKVLLPDLGA